MRQLISRHRFRDVVSIALASLIFGCSFLQATCSVLGAVPRAEKSAEQMATLKQRILEIPPGTMIEVRLLDKKKIRGRLGEISNDSFSLQTVRGGNSQTQQINFAEVESLKTVKGKAGHVVLFILAGIAAAYLIWFAIAGPR